MVLEQILAKDLETKEIFVYRLNENEYLFTEGFIQEETEKIIHCDLEESTFWICRFINDGYFQKLPE